MFEAMRLHLLIKRHHFLAQQLSPTHLGAASIQSGFVNNSRKLEKKGLFSSDFSDFAN